MFSFDCSYTRWFQFGAWHVSILNIMSSKSEVFLNEFWAFSENLIKKYHFENVPVDYAIMILKHIYKLNPKGQTWVFSRASKSMHLFFNQIQLHLFWRWLKAFLKLNRRLSLWFWNIFGYRMFDNYLRPHMVICSLHTFTKTKKTVTSIFTEREIKLDWT